jgi:hypothetical protein
MHKIYSGLKGFLNFNFGTYGDGYKYSSFCKPGDGRNYDSSFGCGNGVGDIIGCECGGGYGDGDGDGYGDCCCECCHSYGIIESYDLSIEESNA